MKIVLEEKYKNLQGFSNYIDYINEGRDIEKSYKSLTDLMFSCCYWDTKNGKITAEEISPIIAKLIDEEFEGYPLRHPYDDYVYDSAKKAAIERIKECVKENGSYRVVTKRAHYTYQDTYVVEYFALDDDKAEEKANYGLCPLDSACLGKSDIPGLQMWDICIGATD